MTARNGGVSQLIEDMRISWGNMMRSSLGFKAFIEAGSMSPEQLYAELEKASHIGALEWRQVKGEYDMSMSIQSVISWTKKKN